VHEEALTPPPRQRRGSSSRSSASIPKSSAREARFGEGPPLTLGVEEEHMLVSADGFGLCSEIEAVLHELEGGELASRVHPELTESTAEIATGICSSVDDALRELTELRRGLATTLLPLGMHLAASGTHPFSLAEDQRITRRDRYRQLVEQLQYVARRELVFGMHIHVAVPDPETCMKVMEGVLIELPILLALSSNSPFWRGEITGLASTRTAVFAGFPRSGLPPRFDSYDDYAESVGWLEGTGAIVDYTRLWWDVRPHPRLGTLEVRVMDVQFDLEYAMALTAYVQSLVAQLIAEIEAGNPPRPFHRLLVAENKWLAARYGLEAPLIDLETGRKSTMTAAQLAKRRLRQLAPYAKDLGCLDALRGIERMLSWGTGATRQMRVYNANRDLVEVMREVCELSEAAPA
jgi:glutamate---cysteine ligase / carboxylate-amine ligase